MTAGVAAPPANAAGARVRVRWSNVWTAEHDAALAGLPEMPRCSHELFKRLAINPTAVQKRIALVLLADRPIALVGLRQNGAGWQLVTDNAVPWCLFPAVPGMEATALASLGVRVVSLQDRDVSGLGFSCHPYTVYRAGLKDDFERFWRGTGYHKTVRKARNQTPDIQLRIDQPEDLKAVIRFWCETWQNDPEEQTSAAPDIELANLELMKTGQVHVVALALEGRTVGGQVLYALDNDVIEQTHGWDRTLSDLRIGTRIRDAAFQWSAEAGFDHYDLGGGYAYKADWAPEDGVRYGVVYEPRESSFLPAIRRRIRGALHRIRGR